MFSKQRKLSKSVPLRSRSSEQAPVKGTVKALNWIRPRVTRRKVIFLDGLCHVVPGTATVRTDSPDWHTNGLYAAAAPHSLHLAGNLPAARTFNASTHDPYAGTAPQLTPICYRYSFPRPTVDAAVKTLHHSLIEAALHVDRMT